MLDGDRLRGGEERAGVSPRGGSVFVAESAERANAAGAEAGEGAGETPASGGLGALAVGDPAIASARARSAVSPEHAWRMQGTLRRPRELRQLQALGGVLYVCGPSLQHFGVDPKQLAVDDVIVCEYLTFMEVMQQADLQRRRDGRAGPARALPPGAPRGPLPAR